MCGILGIAISKEACMSRHLLQTTMNKLFLLSESRGKESAGLAIQIDDTIHIFKVPYPASQMIRSSAYRYLLNKMVEGKTYPKVMIGHSRLVTNGSEVDNSNNQPVRKEGVLGVHNGIIVNVDDLWETHHDLNRQSEVDTEILIGILGASFRKTRSIKRSSQIAFSKIDGTAAIAALFEESNCLLLATNNGSLYTYETTNQDFTIFASERYILKQLSETRGLSDFLADCRIISIEPGKGRLIDLESHEYADFSLTRELSDDKDYQCKTIKSREVTDHSPSFANIDTRFLGIPISQLNTEGDDQSLLVQLDVFDSLKRCTLCILPETFPFIEFDDEGVCNYCRNSETPQLRRKSELKRITDKYRKDSDPDCLVMISGGRDSVYGLHYMKTVLGMNPVAYTYDWGMVTDLARRNIARICGKLGIEHILLSADIRQKRFNIRKNVLAWLRKPNLGTIPLIMAGDKQYLYFANKVMQQMEVDLVVLSANQFERTHFKTGFCGVKPNMKGRKDISGLRSELKLVSYYARSAITNPAYINSTMLDTLFGLASFYNIPHNYLRLYDYIQWNEQKIMSTLVQEYDWEVASDTTLTWRIGDGTAPFYNYIYHTIAGFTENDTFRSNQIRARVLDRETALRIVREENKPRYNGLKWYLTVIGLGGQFNKIISRINNAPRLY